MVSLRVLCKKAARPQTAAALLFVMFIIGGYFTLPKIVRPTEASGVPVIQPIEQKVQGLALTAPIDCSKMPCLARTFDAGSTADVAPTILDISKTANTIATICLLGLHVAIN